MERLQDSITGDFLAPAVKKTLPQIFQDFSKAISGVLEEFGLPKPAPPSWIEIATGILTKTVVCVFLLAIIFSLSLSLVAFGMWVF